MKNKIIYVICPHNNDEPSGGVKQLYRLVDVLNHFGHEAYIIHDKDNFRVKWFDHETPIKYFPSFFNLLYEKKKKKIKFKIPSFITKSSYQNRLPEPESIIVFPEIYGPNINKLCPQNKIVIFNQNCYYSFNKYEVLKTNESPYENENTLGCMVVSQDSLNYLKYPFPNLNLHRIRLGINHHFVYSKTKKNKLLLCRVN